MSANAEPFDDEEDWDEGENVLVDNGEPGVPVRALYDYEGAESDELSFKQGNCINEKHVNKTKVKLVISIKKLKSNRMQNLLNCLMNKK